LVIGHWLLVIGHCLKLAKPEESAKLKEADQEKKQQYKV